MTAPLRFLCLAGDGIGPEIMSATLDVLDALRPALSRPVEIIERDIGFASLKANGTTITDAVIDTAQGGGWRYSGAGFRITRLPPP